MKIARTFALAAAAAACLLAAGASAQTAPAPAKPAQRNFTPYPPVVRTNFMGACTGGGLAEAVCDCIHRNMEREFLLAEYVELDTAVSQGKPHPFEPRFAAIVQACYADNKY